MKHLYFSLILKTAVLLMCAAVFAAMAGAAYAEGTDMRQTINFNTDWLYSPYDYSNAELKDFDDSGFETVSIPHANTILTQHKGPNFQAQIDSYRFVSWYRRHFTLPECYEDGKRVIVEFEGVATVAEVYVNGEYIGEHKGAYTGFSYDITDSLKTDGSDNVIAVRVDSTKRSDIPPEGGSVDYCLFGGIVRDVNMIVTGGAYLENTFVTTPELADSEGASTTVRNATQVVNKSDADMELSVETIVKDADGNITASGRSEAVTVGAGETFTFEQNTDEIVSPHLWDGIDDPYLYTAVTRVMDGDECIDNYETKLGFRWFEFKKGGKDASFYLNGQKTELVGVNRHEQWPWIGRAVVNKLQRADADLIKETGFNAVRCSHYPQDPSFLDRCDELGLIVFEEAPGWQYIGGEAWKKLYVTNVEEMIIRDRNHASIISWGTRVNESLDDWELCVAANTKAKELDSTRPTHGVRRSESYSKKNEYSYFYKDYEDIFVVNYQQPEIPREVPFVIGEHSWDCWTNGYGCPWATDEQALAFAKDFADKVNYYYGNDLCAGGFAWSMFDYDNEVNYTGTNNVFYSGLYDIFRLPKPVSNVYKSQKDPETDPMVYIANYWDDDAKPLTVDSVTEDIAQGGSSGGAGTEGDCFSVTVMSNCDSVELFINGNKVDVTPGRLYNNLPHPFFVFDNIEYEAGEITAVGYDADGNELARYTQKTPGTPAKLTLTPDYDTIIADGADFTSVTITALDADGNYVPLADNEVTITVEGCGKFIGEETIALEGGRSAFFVQSKYLQTGTVHCTVTANGMESAECDISIAAFDEEIVPVSEGEGSIEPVKVKVTTVNDSETGIIRNTFNYTGTWGTASGSGFYNSDNTYSNTAGDQCAVRFEGTSIQWYGSKASNHGIMAVSVDGGEETLIDCYAAEREDDVLLFDSGSLKAGLHTLTVRVTGDKNSAASDCYINADRVVIEENEESYSKALLNEDFSDKENGKLALSVSKTGEEFVYELDEEYSAEALSIAFDIEITSPNNSYCDFNVTDSDGNALMYFNFVHPKDNDNYSLTYTTNALEYDGNNIGSASGQKIHIETILSDGVAEFLIDGKAVAGAETDASGVKLLKIKSTYNAAGCNIDNLVIKSLYLDAFSHDVQVTDDSIVKYTTKWLGSEQGEFITAVYNSGGVLVGVNIGAEGEIRLEEEGVYTVKSFIWDGTETMKPLYDAAVSEIAFGEEYKETPMPIQSETPAPASPSPTESSPTPTPDATPTPTSDANDTDKEQYITVFDASTLSDNDVNDTPVSDKWTGWTVTGENANLRTYDGIDYLQIYRTASGDVGTPVVYTPDGGYGAGADSFRISFVMRSSGAVADCVLEDIDGNYIGGYTYWSETGGFWAGSGERQYCGNDSKTDANGDKRLNTYLKSDIITGDKEGCKGFTNNSTIMTITITNYEADELYEEPYHTVSFVMTDNGSDTVLSTEYYSGKVNGFKALHSYIEDTQWNIVAYGNLKIETPVLE